MNNSITIDIMTVIIFNPFDEQMINLSRNKRNNTTIADKFPHQNNRWPVNIFRAMA